MGPYLDQLSRLDGRFTTVLTGYDGDALLGSATRLHWRERLSEGRLGTLARDLLWYLRTVRALPPIGVRTFLARARRDDGEPQRPSWLRDTFWRRAGLAQRRASSLRAPDVTRSREPARWMFTGPAWGLMFDSFDPGCLGQAIDVRHPLTDLRLIRFTFGLPAVPWCVDKHLLRRCLDGLPRAVLTRNKTPLAVDFDAEMFRTFDPRASHVRWQSGRMAPFLDVASMQSALDESAGRAAPSWQLIRAICLGAWLTQRDSVELIPSARSLRATLAPVAAINHHR
jgi:hypothetical protein